MIGIALLALLGGAAPAAPAPRGATALPTEMCRGYFFVPVTLPTREGQPADRTLWFLYDTGAAYSVVDPESVARVSTAAVSAGQTARFGEVAVGPAPLGDFRARVVDLDHLSVALGRELDGILAVHAFGDPLVTLDYAAGEVRLEPGRLPRPDGRTVLRARGPDVRPWLRLRLPGGPRRLLLDSGAARASLVVEGLAALPTEAPPAPVHVAVGLHDLETRGVARIDGAVWMGAFRIDDPMARDTRDTELIGGRVMEHFRWTVDNRRRRVRIEPVTPGAPVETPPHRSRGLMLVPDAPHLLVQGVVPGTPAAAAGVQAGDRVTHFDGVPAAVRGCAEPAGPVRLTVVRGDAVREVTLAAEVLVP